MSNAREYIYSTALSPVNAALALAATEHCVAHPELRLKLLENIQLFKQLCLEAKVPLLGSDTAIQPVIIGDSQQTLRISSALKERGFGLGRFVHPLCPLDPRGFALR